MKKKIEEIRKENGLIFRQDITDILQNWRKLQNPDHKWTKKDMRDYQVFEKDGFLYKPDYQNEDTIQCFQSLGDILLWQDDGRDLAKEIEDEFKLEISKHDYIVCNCGLDDHFMAYTGNYELTLECNVCGHTFCAYSG